MKVLGPRSYVIQLDLGKQVRRHLDHVKSRSSPVTESEADDLVFPPTELADDAAGGEMHNPDPHNETPDVGVRRSGPYQPPS